MNTFLTNKNYRMLLINQWVSSFGDTLFYISFISYVSGYQFASLAVLCITVSETLPQISQLFTGVIADFQKNRVAKYIAILASKFLLYTLLTLFVTDKNFSMGMVFLICGINLLSDTMSYFAGAMISPLYVRIIGDDMTDAMGFRQATAGVVNILSNLIGGVLIGVISLQMFVGLNALTFLFALLGVVFIRTSLRDIEGQMEVSKRLTAKSFGEHFLYSMKILASFPAIIKLIFIAAMNQMILSIITPLTTLMLIHHPFIFFDTGQSIAVLSVVTFSGTIVGSFLSGGILKNIPIKMIVYFEEIMQLCILFSWLTNHFLLLLVVVFLCAVAVGMMGPRIFNLVFSMVPEEVMGTIQSVLGVFNVVVPGILSMLIVALASATNLKTTVIPLFIFVLTALAIVRAMKIE
ncbi:MAG: MFS transporter [Streptococcus mitis]|nr:MFS transporter [Streptococcus mitis]